MAFQAPSRYPLLIGAPRPASVSQAEPNPMNASSPSACHVCTSAGEAEIRDYAYHLYIQNGHRNDQCAANWQEAEACLRSHIPKAESHVRLSKALLSGTLPGATPGGL
jgi:hypothetical protein